jgi:UDP-N-acetylmuramate dehydrogenase
METDIIQSKGMDSRQRRELSALCPAIRWDVDMAAYSTFRTGGVVEALADINAIDELATVLQYLRRENVPWYVVGGGSNILVARRYHHGVFIRLRGTVGQITSELTHSVDGNFCRVTVHAGCNLAALLGWCIRNNLSGLEFMAGIPGSVGGAIRMNAGAFGHAISEPLLSIQVMNTIGQRAEIPKEEADFGYRSSRFPGESNGRLLITGGVFCLQPADGHQIAARCRDIIAVRRNKQPKGVGSAGSFFKNPEGDFAGRLIEQAGLKGLQCGKAMVSPTHANFIVNMGGAAPDDIIGLMEEVQQQVFRHSGVLLEPEVCIY